MAGRMVDPFELQQPTYARCGLIVSVTPRETE
jgi:hypothetical protein